MKIKLTERFKKNNSDTKSKRKRKIKPKWIITGVVVLAVVLFFILRPNDRLPDNLVSRVDLTELFTSDIEYTISATGTVESNNSHKVYAAQNYKIEDVLVEVGDFVSIGQQLLVLDTSSLEDQIETKEISMVNTGRSSAQQIKTASDTYNAARNAIENGTNSSLISAESSVRTAYENLQKAIKTYDDYVASRANGTNSTLVTQENQVNSAKLNRDQAQGTVDTAKKDRESASKSRDQALSTYNTAYQNQQLRQDVFDTAESAYQLAEEALAIDPSNAGLEAARDIAKSAHDDAGIALNNAKDTAKIALESFNAAEANLTAKRTAQTNAEKALEVSQASYETAVKSRNAAYSTADTTLQDYGKNIETARAAYNTALQSQTAAEETAKASLQQNLNSLNTAQINANTELSDLEYERMLRNLEDAKITADEAGIITAVYATIGNAATGILFVIEDINDLIIETTISEFDVGTVKVGMPVTLKSEATKDTIYDGTVVSIAPTSNKNVQGNTDKVGDAVFATKIKVNSVDTELRIGMSVRLNFIIERQENILAVPYDAVYVNDTSDECIMVIFEMGNNNGEISYELREIPVIAGLENDYSIVVSGNGIKEGITVVNNPSNYRELVGKTIYLTDKMITSGNNMGMMFGF